MKKEEETNKNEKGLMNKNFVIEYFDVVLFHETKAKKKQKEEGGKNKKPKESKKERQEDSKQQKRKRETDKGKWKRGRPKSLRRNRGRHSKINKKCPF